MRSPKIFSEHFSDSAEMSSVDGILFIVRGEADSKSHEGMKSGQYYLNIQAGAGN